MKGKEKNTKKSKLIKVAYSSCERKRNTALLPKIKMEGKWLEELGFHIGDRLVVEYGEGSIHITHADAEGRPAVVCEDAAEYGAASMGKGAYDE